MRPDADASSAEISEMRPGDATKITASRIGERKRLFLKPYQNIEKTIAITASATIAPREFVK